LQDLKLRYLNDCQSLLADLDSIRRRLQSIESDPGNRAWDAYVKIVNALAAFCLSGSNTEEVKKAAEESKLISGMTGARIGAADREACSVLAEHCRFLCSLLEGDVTAAMLNVYVASETFPQSAVQVYPEFMFSTSYREILSTSFRELQRTKRSYFSVRKVNTGKRRMSLPTYLIRNLVYAPVSYVIALTKATRHLSDSMSLSGHRSRSYWGRVRTLREHQLKMFDSVCSERGWTIGGKDNQKELMLLDQVKRLTSIYNNHILAIRHDARAKTRDIEAELKSER
jgi:hypothetical protein